MEEKILVWKGKEDWISQAKEALEKAEKYGAFKIADMREEEKSSLRQAMDALGMDVKF
ncbi:MAG: hypothetical protein KAW47_08305 [Thermoplasmatales archaeon]|nr:hypothetical protein [Thermoplasmatales archaeon]